MDFVRINVILVYVLVTISTGEKCFSGTQKDKHLKCDYIPSKIPDDIIKVTIKRFAQNTREINSTIFDHTSWKTVSILELIDDMNDFVKVINISAFSFQPLTSLTELRISLNGRFEIDENVFKGLNTVKILDVSECYRMSRSNFMKTINHKEKLPALEILKMSNFGKYFDPEPVDLLFMESFKDKHMKEIDLSFTQISLFDINAFVNLNYSPEKVNLSHALISSTEYKGCSGKVANLRMVDLSHATLPNKVFEQGIDRIEVVNMILSEKKKTQMKYYSECMFQLRVLNISDVVKYSSVSCTNCSADIDLGRWTLEEVILEHNNLVRLDIQMSIKVSFQSMTVLSLARNRLEYLHPSILKCSPNLRKLNLSNNKMYVMVYESIGRFEKLFSSLQHLTYVDLSANGLLHIPVNLFRNNKKLETINLATNKLTSIGFTLKYLSNLKSLDLRNNNIEILDDKSKFHLMTWKTLYSVNIKPSVLLQSNPFKCSQCMHIKYIKWLLSFGFVNVRNQKINCAKDSDNSCVIGNDCVLHLQGICNRKKILLFISVASGTTAVLVFVIVTVICVRRKRVQKLLKRHRAIQKLKDHTYEFAVFLSFCDEDADFVYQHVKQSLEEHLCRVTEIHDRCLICTHDSDFRPGFPIVGEVYRLLERSAVGVSIVSKAYCSSSMCSTDLDPAYLAKIPVVLMFLEDVNEDVMIPSLKHLYKRYPNIVRMENNNDGILNTDWEEVCSYIIDLII